MPETHFDFDVLPERRGTGAIKWDRFPEYTPFWVADMDFASPDCVVEAMRSRVEHGVFGYAHAHEGLVNAVLRPVYYPFFKVPSDADANLIDVPFIRNENTWRFDWDAMESAVTPETRLLILCNPQNPLGRVFSEQEIHTLADFCERHDIVLVSDEIHCDLILDPEQSHYSALRLPESFHSRLITLMAPSKTYNIAGLGYSFAVIKDAELRKKFNHARGCTVPEINALSMFAAEAAYQSGEPWRRDLIEYLRGNRDLLADFIAQEMPVLKIHEHAATYLYWIDCSELGISHPVQFFADHAGVFLTDGTPFGSNQHVRFNFGCPREHMLKGLQAMKEAIDGKLTAAQ